jgi:hypothetical protein
MYSIPYDWKILSVDTITNTFVVEYTNTQDNEVVALNLPLPLSLDSIPTTAQRYAPKQKWVKPPVVVPTILPVDAILALSGSAVIIPEDMSVMTAAANEAFKKQVATALFELGITSNNMYVAPAASATTTSPGSAPTVIG